MAHNDFLSPVWIAPNADVYWWYTYHNDQGAQYAEANCKTPDAQLMTTAQGERREDDGTVTYFINIHNYGPRACFHNLNVGGLT